MKAKYVEITVTRDAHAAMGKVVLEHEVAILEEIYGEVVLEEVLSDTRAIDAAEEYARLETVYGNEQNEDGSAGSPFVRVAYGRFNDGRFEKVLADNADALKGDSGANILDLSIAKATEALAGLNESSLNDLLDAEYAGKTRQGMIDAIENALAEL